MTWLCFVAFVTLAVVPYAYAQQDCPWTGQWVDVPASDPHVERRYRRREPPCTEFEIEDRLVACPPWSEWTAWADIPGDPNEVRIRSRSRGSPCTGTQIQLFQPACPQNIVITVDTSSSVSRPRFRQLRDGVILMLRNADIKEPFTHVGICYFGTTAEAIVSLTPFHNHTDVNHLVNTSTTLSGRTKVSLGLECLHNEWLSSTRPGTYTVCVLVIDGNPSDPPNDAEELAKTRSWVDTLKTNTCDEFVIFAIGNAFTDIDEVESWKDPTTPNNYFNTPSFAQFRDIFLDENVFPTFCPIDGQWSAYGDWSDCSVTCGGGRRFRVRTCTNPIPSEGGSDCDSADGDSQDEECNPDPCPPPAPISDCDDCIIINGIGYKDVDPCWQYLQCYFDEGGQVVRAVLRTAAWGAFWNQYDINQDFPWNTDCRFDLCRNQDIGYRYPRPDNCRAYWQCGRDGRTSGLFCCDEGYRFDQFSQDCVVDSGITCSDPCPPILPTSGGPLPCPLRLREGTENRFYNELDPGAEDMFCADTQVFDEQLCTCVNLIHDGCLPEVWIDFRNKTIADVSRNKYYIDVRGVEVGSRGVGSELEYYGIFDKALMTQLIIDGMASIDPGEKLAVYARYTRQDVSSGPARPAILSNSDCLPLDYSYAAFINPSSNGGVEAGFVRSEEPGSNTVENTNRQPDINEYIMEYQGDVLGSELKLELNNVDAAPANPGPTGRVGQNSCALHIGYGQAQDNFDYFTGKILEVRVYRCIPSSYSRDAAAGLP